jgi:hypothetical protein
MKSYLQPLFAAALSLNLSCGAANKATQTGESAPFQDPSVNKSGEFGGPASYGSMLVETSKDLPACNEDKKGALAYVRSEEKFYVCSGEWGAVAIKTEQETASKNPMLITKIQKMQRIRTNFCTEFSSIDSCYFAGGQVISLADGNMLITATWDYFAYSSISHDSDTDLATQTFLIPKDKPMVSAKLHGMVARGDGYKDVYLVYNRELDRFLIIYDNNDSGDVDGTDLVLSEVSLVSM